MVRDWNWKSDWDLTASESRLLLATDCLRINPTISFEKHIPTEERYESDYQVILTMTIPSLSLFSGEFGSTTESNHFIDWNQTQNKELIELSSRSSGLFLDPDRYVQCPHNWFHYQIDMSG